MQALASKQTSLARWIKQISEVQMPVFGRTAQDLGKLVADESSHRSQLCGVILNDAAMTARVLRLANTVYYNPSGQQMSSVSRAVVVLGVNGIRSICLTVALIDSLLSGAPRARAAKEMAKAIYAAVLARNIAELRGSQSPEETFVAALLYRLGAMAFSCFGGELVDDFETKLAEADVVKEKVERELLGFSLLQLTEGLVENWSLSDQLLSALNDRNGESCKHPEIVLSNHFAETNTGPLDDPATQLLINQIAELSHRSIEETLRIIEQCSHEAVKAAREFGAELLVQQMPKPKPKRTSDTAAEQKSDAIQPVESLPPTIALAAPPLAEPFQILEADPLLQLKILREMTMLLNESADFNNVIEVTLEGIYRGIGLDRALFTLLTPDRKHLRAKFALGADREQLMELFDLQVVDRKSVFSELLTTKESRHMNAVMANAATRALPPAIQSLIKGPFFAAATVVNGKTIGVFYADRQKSGRQLDDDSFDSFLHFTNQANLTLDAISRKSSGRKP